MHVQLQVMWVMFTEDFLCAQLLRHMDVVTNRWGGWLM